MPELPEVETVKEGLKELLGNDPIVTKIKVINPKLRFPVPKNIEKIKNQKIVNLKRRAKYLVFELEDYQLFSHLGMTGTWREFKNDRKKHDHIDLYFGKDKILTYCDPRKFGLFEYRKSDEVYERFLHLGPEPLSTEFSANYLWEKTRNKTVKIKTLIMNQLIVVGVGNIYAVESLFKSCVRPTRKAHKITKKECELLVKNIKSTLKLAIKAGGSTISDFKQAGGDKGYFQHSFKVYGRENQKCYVCKKTLKNIVISNRSSVYCPNCQN